MGNVTIKQLKEKLKSIENINEVRPNNKYSMFHLLVRYGQDPRMIDYLISAGVDYTLETKLGGKALHYVVERKDQAYEFTKKLIAYDKDIDAKDHYYDSTPLIWATSSRAPVSVIKLLLDNKADANIKNNKGNTALIATTKSNPTNEKGFLSIRKTVQILLDNKADVTVKNIHGKTALDYMKENKEFTKTELFKKLSASFQL